MEKAKVTSALKRKKKSAKRGNNIFFYSLTAKLEILHEIIRFNIISLTSKSMLLLQRIRCPVETRVLNDDDSVI